MKSCTTCKPSTKLEPIKKDCKGCSYPTTFDNKDYHYCNLCTVNTYCSCCGKLK